MNTPTGRIFKYIRRLKMANAWISEMENDIEELQFTHEDITRKIQGKNERYMEGKEKGRKQLKQT